MDPGDVFLLDESSGLAKVIFCQESVERDRRAELRLTLQDKRVCNRHERLRRFRISNEPRQAEQPTMTPVTESCTLRITQQDVGIGALFAYVVTLPAPPKRIGFYDSCAMLAFSSSEDAEIAQKYINGDSTTTMTAIKYKPEYSLPPLPHPIGKPIRCIRVPFDEVHPTPDEMLELFYGYGGCLELNMDKSTCYAVFQSVDEATIVLEDLLIFTNLAVLQRACLSAL